MAVCGAGAATVAVSFSGEMAAVVVVVVVVVGAASVVGEAEHSVAAVVVLAVMSGTAVLSVAVAAEPTRTALGRTAGTTGRVRAMDWDCRRKFEEMESRLQRMSKC